MKTVNMKSKTSGFLNFVKKQIKGNVKEVCE